MKLVMKIILIILRIVNIMEYSAKKKSVNKKLYL